jgi:hypothetical protein
MIVDIPGLSRGPALLQFGTCSASSCYTAWSWRWGRRMEAPGIARTFGCHCPEWRSYSHNHFPDLRTEKNCVPPPNRKHNIKKLNVHSLISECTPITRINPRVDADCMQQCAVRRLLSEDLGHDWMLFLSKCKQNLEILCWPLDLRGCLWQTLGQFNVWEMAPKPNCLWSKALIQ